MKSKYIYSVYDKKTELLIALGTANEVSKAIGVKPQSLREALARAKNGKNIKYTYAKEIIEPLPPEPDPDKDERMTPEQAERFVKRWNNMRARYIGRIHIANPCDKCQQKERCADVGIMCPAWERYFKLEWDYRLRELREKLRKEAENA